jgi:hypothetical protein
MLKITNTMSLLQLSPMLLCKSTFPPGPSTYLCSGLLFMEIFTAVPRKLRQERCQQAVIKMID